MAAIAGDTDRDKTDKVYAKALKDMMAAEDHLEKNRKNRGKPKAVKVPREPIHRRRCCRYLNTIQRVTLKLRVPCAHGEPFPDLLPSAANVVPLPLKLCPSFA